MILLVCCFLGCSCCGPLIAACSCIYYCYHCFSHFSDNALEHIFHIKSFVCVFHPQSMAVLKPGERLRPCHRRTGSREDFQVSTTAKPDLPGRLSSERRSHAEHDGLWGVPVQAGHPHLLSAVLMLNTGLHRLPAGCTVGFPGRICPRHVPPERGGSFIRALGLFPF